MSSIVFCRVRGYRSYAVACEKKSRDKKNDICYNCAEWLTEDLQALGYSKKQIERMKVEEALKVIEQEVPASCASVLKSGKVKILKKFFKEKKKKRKQLEI